MYVLASEYGERKKTYLCTSPSDIDILPKYGIRGSQGTNEKDDEPCIYGSTALVKSGSDVNVYMLFPDNIWTKV